jgi:hydroxyacylglutathione hydrolase
MKLVNNLYFYPELGMLDCNKYVATGNPGVIFDTGNPDFLPALLDGLARDGVNLRNIGYIVNTHLHIDHCSANDEFKRLSGARIALHPVQEQHYRAVVIDGARLFGMTPTEFTADMVLDGDQLEAGGASWEMVKAPGHSPECVCFYDRAGKVLICGDVVFEMNTGRVDLPGGNAVDLKKSIEALAQLDVEYLLPGHMGVVAGAARVKANFDFIRSNVFPWL